MTVAAWLFGAGGVLLAGIGAFFEQLLPQLRRWLRRVFVVLGGHTLTAGGLTIWVAAIAAAVWS